MDGAAIAGAAIDVVCLILLGPMIFDQRHALFEQMYDIRDVIGMKNVSLNQDRERVGLRTLHDHRQIYLGKGEVVPWR